MLSVLLVHYYLHNHFFNIKGFILINVNFSLKREKMEKVLLLIVTCLLFNCASPYLIYEEHVPFFKAKKDSAHVVIIRPKGHHGNESEIYLDRAFKTRTLEETIVSFDADTGLHYLIIKNENSFQVRLQLNPGKVYYLRENPTSVPFPGFSIYRTSLYTITENQLDSIGELGNFRYGKVNPNKIEPDLDDNFFEEMVVDYETWINGNHDEYLTHKNYRGF